MQRLKGYESKLPIVRRVGALPSGYEGIAVDIVVRGGEATEPRRSQYAYPAINKVIQEVAKTTQGRKLIVNIVGTGADYVRETKKIRTYQPYEIEQMILRQNVPYQITATDMHPNIIQALREYTRIERMTPNLIVYKKYNMGKVHTKRDQLKKGDINIYTNVGQWFDPKQGGIFLRNLKETVKDRLVIDEDTLQRIGQWSHEKTRRDILDDARKRLCKKMKREVSLDDLMRTQINNLAEEGRKIILEHSISELKKIGLVQDRHTVSTSREENNIYFFRKPADK